MERTGPVSPKEYASFVFDLDGTLFTLPVDWTAVRNGVERLADVHLDGTPLFPQIGGLLARRPELKEPVFESIDAHELKAAEGAKPMVGAIELLRMLSDGAVLALVTMQGLPLCKSLFERYQLEGIFAARVTREDSLDRAEQLRTALKSTGSSQDRALFVGDRPADVVAGRQARVDVALFGGAVVKDPAPDYRFLNYQDFKSYFL